MITLDLSIEAGDWPAEAELQALCENAIVAALAELALAEPIHPADLSLLFTDDAHIRALNAEWRAKDKPTNVLSFPAFPPDKGGRLPPLLGDIVLAWETVSTEARDEAKPLDHHIGHLIVHGFLHLAGYDHETDADAEEMEALERRVMARLAIPDPYA